MSYTEEEKKEIQKLIKEVTGQDIDIQKYSDKEMEMLNSDLSDLIDSGEIGALQEPMQTEAPKKGLNLGSPADSILTKAFNALDTLGSASRKSIVKGIDSLAGTELDKGEKGFEDIGQYANSAKILEKAGVPSGPTLLETAVTPMTALPLLGLKALGINPDVRDVGGLALDVVTDPTAAITSIPKFARAVGRGASKVIEPLAKGIYKGPLAKLEAAILEKAPHAGNLSDILYKEGISGNYKEIRDQMELLRKKIFNEKIDPILTDMDKAGFSLNVDDVANQLKNEYETTSSGKDVGLLQRPFIKDQLNDVKTQVLDALRTFEPVGWKDKVNTYKKQRIGALKDEKSFKRANGAGEQLPIFGHDDPSKTGFKKVDVKLRGKDANIPYAEPYEVWTQQELPSLPTKSNSNLFNPVDAKDKLLPLAQQMELDKLFREAAQGPKYQGEILNLAPVPESSAKVKVKVSKIKRGQGAFPIPPTFPEMPKKTMNVWEALASKKDAQDLVRASTYSKKGAPPAAELVSNLQAPVASKFRKAIEQGAEDLVGKGKGKELAEFNKIYGTLSEGLPSMSNDVVKEAGHMNLTPLDISFMTNPHTSQLAFTKEILEAGRLPSFRTKTGIALRDAADLVRKNRSFSDNIKTQAIPYFLARSVGSKNKNSEQIQKEKEQYLNEINKILGE